MKIHRRKRPKVYVQMPLTSLIDIVFLLLIYFLLTTNFMVDEGINVKLPRADASSPQTEEVITLYIDKEGRSFLGTEGLPNAKLFDRLKVALKDRENKLIIIKADRGVILNKVVNVMDIAKAAGAARLCLATEKGP